MSLSRRSFALHLAMTPGVGGRSVVRVLARNDLLGRTAEEFLRLSPEALREEYRLNARQAANLAADPRGRVERDAVLERRLDALGVRLLTAADAGYPDLVEAFDPDPPGVLFLHGNVRLLKAPTFAVLASRATLPWRARRDRPADRGGRARRRDARDRSRPARVPALGHRSPTLGRPPDPRARPGPLPGARSGPEGRGVPRRPPLALRVRPGHRPRDLPPSDPRPTLSASTTRCGTASSRLSPGGSTS